MIFVKVFHQRVSADHQVDEYTETMQRAIDTVLNHVQETGQIEIVRVLQTSTPLPVAIAGEWHHVVRGEGIVTITIVYKTL